MHKKLKVLFFSSHIIHDKLPMAGNQTFNYYLGRFASDTDFEVGYVVSQKGSKDYLLMKQQFSSCKDFSFTTSFFKRAYNYLHYNKNFRKATAIFSSKSYYINSAFRYSFIGAAKKIHKQKWIPEIIVLEWTEMLFLYHSIKKIFPNAKYVCSEHDLAFVSMERLFEEKSHLQKSIASRFKKVELKLLNHIDLIAVHNILDYTRLQSNGVANDKIVVISPFFNSYLQSVESKTYNNSIIFFGAMGRSENIHAVKWFIDEVFIPFNLYKNFNFIVIGGKGELLQKEYANVQNLLFTGYIENPEQYFREALCMVAPIFYGAGIKVKVIEGMKACLPVLTTKTGIDGINAIDKQDFFLCNTPEDYNDILLNMLSNKDLPNKIGMNALSVVERDFNYSQSYQTYKKKILDTFA